MAMQVIAVKHIYLGMPVPTSGVAPRLNNRRELLAVASGSGKGQAGPNRVAMTCSGGFWRRLPT
jgi:hypothetical protein